MAVDGERIARALKNLDGDRALRNLLERELGYEGERGIVSTDGWREDVSKALAGEPELFATAGKDGRFGIVRVRLSEAGKLSLGAERGVMERLRDAYPYALFVFSDAEDVLWHFVNAPHGERVANKQYRRIVVGPDEGLRTATDRISLLSVDDLADRLGKEPEVLSPLEIQGAHDEAFDVEAVTKEFFREYRRVFERVESSITGIDDEERRRFFAQRLFNRLMFVAFVEKKRWMRLSLRFNPAGSGRMQQSFGECMMGTSWNLPMLFAPSAARSTIASTADPTPSSSWPTPSSPRTAPPLLPLT